MENFTNSVLFPEGLPEILLEDFTRLDKKYLSILFIRIAIFALLLTCGFIVYLVNADEALPGTILVAIISAFVLLVGYSVTVSILGFPQKGYLLREKDISYKTGLLFYKQVSVTFNRIQHVEVSQGILAKLFGLSSVKIFTAGGSASDLTIPGLPTPVAQKLKAFISEKISRYE